MAVLIGAALLSVLVTVGIVLSLLLPAISFFREVSISEFLFGTRWTPRFSGQESYGVLPLLTGTAWTTLIALLIAIPFGLGAATYLSEYAPTRVRKILKPVLEVLAGIPSVVYGFFALTFVAPVILNDLLGLDIGTFSVLSAGLVLGIMIIPTVASLSEDAMSAVPDALRQGSMALGANKMRTTLRVVFPAAVSGIAASIVLALSRAVGETMIVALAAGTQARMVGGPTEVGQTMTGFIAQTATGESTPGTLSYNTLFAVGLLLFVVTFVINMISIRLVRKFREAY
jgi:phosphate transport system permease protein